ncbi:MAG TPA: thioredoxin [Pyrinomonadaceae bacterium]|nr:thioredoxin [Pyrinomonadaceae bacterium]
MSEFIRETTDANFDTEVLGSEKVTLVDFWAEWCAPCRQLTPRLESVAEELNGQVNFYKLNVDDNPATADKYGVRGIPTLILFKEGKEEERIVGLVSKEALSDFLRKYLN